MEIMWKNRVSLLVVLLLVAASVQAAAPKPVIYTLDLNNSSFYVGLSNSQQYDIRHTVACIQGLANREAPRVYVHFYPDFGSVGYEDNQFWLNALLESGGLCEGWNVQPLPTGDYGVHSIDALLEKFRSDVNGVILYDADTATGVSSTSLVATTAAGVEGAIAVRKDTTAGSMYNYLVNDANGPQLPVLIDLTGKFTGTGTIWQTSTASTGSAKCDAYIWAKEKYLDTGKCDPTILMYGLDLWGINLEVTLHAQLTNLDYAVAKKAFCFDLSPWGDEAPNDDPTQPVGTDLDTFRKIMHACNVQNNFNKLIKCCGYLNYLYKYTDFVGGLHGAVETETQYALISGVYNIYMEADALDPAFIANCSFYSSLLPGLEGRRYVQNAPPTYNEMVSEGLIDGSGNVVPGNYILVGMGDYDGASWTMKLGATTYQDSTRGQVNCNWGINAVEIDRASVAMDYLYRHKTAKDFFMAWDSGAGKLCPDQLYGSRLPSGYPSIVPQWKEFNRKYYRMLDYSITGWTIPVVLGNISQTDVDNYSPFSGDGIGNDYNYEQQIPPHLASPVLRNNVPVLDRAQYLLDTTNVINYSSGVHFSWVWASVKTPTYIKSVEDYWSNSGNNHRFLDAYTFYYLLRYHLGGSNNYRATWVSDTIPGIMQTGGSYPVSITVRNDGWDTWNEASLYRLGYAIVSSGVNPTTADYNANGRLQIPTGVSVAPGSQITFTATITAPATSGNFDLYYDMVKDGVAWFRDKNNIEWKKSIIVASDPYTVDTDGGGRPDLLELERGTLPWNPDDDKAKETFLFKKTVLSSVSDTNFYGIDAGDADEVAAGDEIYTVSYNTSTGTGALTEYVPVGSSYNSTVLQTASTPFLDLEIGDVTRELDPSQSFWIESPYDIAYVRGDGYYLATNGTGSWVFRDAALYTGNRPYTPTVNIGSVAVGDAHDGTGGGWQQAWYGSFELETGNMIDMTVLWDRYSNLEGYGFAFYPQCWDLAVGNALSGISGSEQNNEIVSCKSGGVTIMTKGTGAMYQTHDFETFGVRLNRGVALGNVRPASNPSNPDDPWAGQEIVTSLSQHVGYVNGGGSNLPAQNFFKVMAINWKNPVADGVTVGNNAGVMASSYSESFIVEETVNGAGGQTKYPRRIACGDINGDGLDEIVVAAYGTLPSLSVYSWDAAGNYWKSQVIDTSREYYGVKVKDINGDGLADILYAANGEAGVFVSLGKVKGDLDEDGDVDFSDLMILVGNWLIGK